MTRWSPSTARTAKQNVYPIPDYIGTDRDAIPDPLTMAIFPRTSWTPDAPIPLKRATIVAVIPYEELALEGGERVFRERTSRSPPTRGRSCLATTRTWPPNRR